MGDNNAGPDVLTREDGALAANMLYIYVNIIQPTTDC